VKPAICQASSENNTPIPTTRIDMLTAIAAAEENLRASNQWQMG
jgi:hypothetical protein